MDLRSAEQHPLEPASPTVNARLPPSPPAESHQAYPLPTPTASASTSAFSLSSDASATSLAASKPLRSSARVKAAKQKENGKDKDKDRDAAPDAEDGPSRTTRSTSKRVRDQPVAKGKGKESEEAPTRPSKKARRIAQSAITINEPIRDPKGKKRALPESTSEDEDVISPSKRTKATATSSGAYSLRPRTEFTSDMPRKHKSSTGKGKVALKTKSMMAAESSSRLDDDDPHIIGIKPKEDYHDEHEEECCEEADMAPKGEESSPLIGTFAEDPGAGAENSKADGGGDTGDNDAGAPPSSESAAPPVPPPFDESAAMAIFGGYRQLGSYMLSMSSRLKSMLNNIKMSADPTTRLVTLQELSELLSMSTEDTLAGSFPVEAYVRELVKILGGSGASDDDDDEGDDDAPHDEDASLAAALAMSTGGSVYQGDENMEAQVLACRCLANLMEALPGVAHTIVYHGALPVLCSKLLEISYIDLAEQTLSTLEKISEEFPSSIVREGGLAALLNYLDFFSIAVQRTALQAASNCCRNISAEHFPMISGVWSIIRNCLSYSDQRLVEYACLCVIRVIDAYHRSYPQHLESLVDTELIRAVNQLLLPAGGSPLIAQNTFTLLIRALAMSARASPKIALALLEADIVDTVYQILTGVLPPISEGHEEQGGAKNGQGLGGGLADMAVMENLAHRPKDQVEETLGLVSELMPAAPKDGVFDLKGYTEKTLSRMIKAKAKADRALARQAAAAAAAGVSTAPTEAAASAPATPAADDGASGESSQMENKREDTDDPTSAPAATSASDLTELLKSKPAVFGRFLNLIVPVLIDVYAASVILPVRIKTLNGLLKAVTFLDQEGLRRVLALVPVASFASSILSSRDHPNLVIGALQLVETLLLKVPEQYAPAFRREGVFHEVDSLASRPLLVIKSKEKDKEKSKDKDKEKDKSQENEQAPPNPAPATTEDSSAAAVPPVAVLSVGPPKKASSLSLEPEDAVTIRCRVIRFKFMVDSISVDGDTVSEALRQRVTELARKDASESELVEGLKALALMFASPQSSLSSFELQQGGVIDCLLGLATDDGRLVSLERRQELLFEVFNTEQPHVSCDLQEAATPLSILVKKLQESLTRMESYEVITVSQGSDDNKRSSPSLLARQLRLRLITEEGSDIPRNLNNIVVSIHAIATFQALHDYLRPRVSGILSSGGARLLAALAGMPATSSRSSLATQAFASAPFRTAESSTSAGVSKSEQQSGVTRRRSQRLSEKKSAQAGPSNATDAPAAEDIARAGDSVSAVITDTASTAVGDISPENSISEPPVSRAGASEIAPSETLLNDDDDRDFTDDEIDAEVLDDEMDPDTSVNEKTITLNIAEDGSKIEAQTPDGTRVATPSDPLAESLPLPRKPSYAAALKAKPTDWHLEFSMDDNVLPLDLTIYGAIHQHEMRSRNDPAVHPSSIWQGIYSIKFKKVPGAAPSTDGKDTLEGGSRCRSPNPTTASLPDEAAHTKILNVLRVLHKLNAKSTNKSVSSTARRALPESSFVNNKLSAKLSRQLEEPMIVASSCLPDWALDLPQQFPFLFPFATRYNFLQSTSFGYARLILKWQSQQTRGQDTSRRDEGIAFLGRLQRQKVRISRKHILESALKVFELYGSSSSILEVEYFEEVGTGLGPTLEFYSLVSREFARRTLKLWRDEDSSLSGPYVHHPKGLFPAPFDPHSECSEDRARRLHILRVIGQFVAKAMLDSRIIDMSFNKVFLKMVLGEDVAMTVETLKLVDTDLAHSLEKLQVLGRARKSPQKSALVEQPLVEDLALDFTLPGYDLELKPGGRDLPVTSSNLTEYINEVVKAILGKETQAQADAFREGFSKVFPIADLRAFSSDELVMLFGNTDEDWGVETLSEALKADHGYHVESSAIRALIDIMAAYDAPTRRGYLQFITGSPKLPIGGFRGLNPPLTVVRKPHEAPLTADDYLPSVMTCVNYLKLPDYSSKDVMRQKLLIAMKEGVGSFHLS